MEKINVLVVDDHDLIILAIRQVFSKIPDIKLAGVAKDGHEALNKIVEIRPDVVIIDIGLPGIDGIDLTRKVVHDFPGIKVIIHSASVSEETIIAGFEAGALGYVPKNFKPGQLVESIRTVMRGEHYSKGFVSDVLVENYLREKNKKEKNNNLTRRELEVLSHIASGMMNSEIADKFCISVRTIEAHKANIMKKLKLNNTAELVLFAIKNNIVKI